MSKFIKFMRSPVGMLIMLILLGVFCGLFMWIDTQQKEQARSEAKAKQEKRKLEKEIKDSTIADVAANLSDEPKIKATYVDDNEMDESLRETVGNESETEYRRDTYAHNVAYKEPQVKVREVVKYVNADGSSQTVTKEKKVVRVIGKDGKIIEKEFEEESMERNFPTFMVAVTEPEQEPVKEEKQLEAILAPYGRMIKCELVNTVDSINDNSPIIGLTMEDLWYNNELIIPAGSEVHGWSAKQAKNQHVLSQDKWKVILGADASRGRVEGETLDLTAMALHRGDRTGAGRSFTLNDMSPGMLGKTITTNKYKEIKLWVSTFISGMATGLQDRETNPLTGGVQLQGTARNAVLQGNAALLESIAQDIKDEIERNGFYSRVFSSSQFYLYVTQSIRIEESEWDVIGEKDTIPNEKQEPKQNSNPFGIPGFPAIPGLGGTDSL